MDSVLASVRRRPEFAMKAQIQDSLIERIRANQLTNL
jgi:hypothetical protein